MIKITTLVENRSSENFSLKNEHGLSFYIETQNKKILFDLGQFDAYENNSKKLGINLELADFVILSHNHYDHAGGYVTFAKNHRNTRKLYVGKGFFKKKYFSTDNLKYTYLSSGVTHELIKDNDIKCIECKDVLKIDNNIYLISSFETANDLEKKSRLFKKREGADFVTDDFSDEASLIIKTKKGLLLFVGCSHPGIISMINKVEKDFKQNIYGVFGGIHLVNADDSQINFILDEFRKRKIPIIGINHCSGERVLELSKEDKYINLESLTIGDTLFIDE